MSQPGSSSLMRIACIHQGYELYGSDRCFAESVAAIRRAHPEADIEVVLARPGTILTLLEGIATRIVFEPLWILRRRNVWHLATIGLLGLPLAVARAIRRFRANDLVYINTSVIADHIIAARWFAGRAILHIHEIPQGATLTVLRELARWSRAEIVFNSLATQAAFALPPAMRAQVIYNGIQGPPTPEPVTYDGSRRLRLLMLGRISPIKGQEILLEAIAALPAALRARIEVRIVGSAFENPQREQAVRAMAEALRLSDAVSIAPFTADTAPLYRWADVVAIPSRRPESLGRVAIEAMAHGRPPIASAIGGLAEVVADGRTGWLVPPGDSAAFARVLGQIIEHPAGWRDFAAAGHARYLALFSEAAAAEAIAEVVDRMLSGAAPPMRQAHGGTAGNRNGSALP